MTTPAEPNGGGLAALHNPDPFQFKREGLAGKVIGALFAIVFLLILAAGYGGAKAIRVMEQVVASNRTTAAAVEGFNGTMFDVGQYLRDISAQLASNGNAPVYAPQLPHRSSRPSQHQPAAAAPAMGAGSPSIGDSP